MATISRSEFKQQIQEMDPTRFEHFVADLWSEQGWNTRVTREQGDKGIDIVATRDNPVSEKHLIQAKRYAPDNPVGSPEVQQYASLRQQEQAVDAVVIVTSGRFSEQAERVARSLNVKLVDGNALYSMFEDHSHADFLLDYFEEQGEDDSRPEEPRAYRSDDTHTPPSQTTARRFEYARAVALSAVLSILGLGIGITTAPETGVFMLGALLVVQSWVALPILMYIDGRNHTAGNALGLNFPEAFFIVIPLVALAAGFYFEYWMPETAMAKSAIVLALFMIPVSGLVYFVYSQIQAGER